MSPHVARYFQLVDAYLANVSNNDERELLLTREIAKQEKLYEAFMAKLDADLPVHTEVTAYDYITTLSELEARRERRAA